MLYTIYHILVSICLCFCLVGCDLLSPPTKSKSALGGPMWFIPLDSTRVTAVEGYVPFVLYKDGILCVRQENGKQFLGMHHVSNGSLQWKWSDMFLQDEVLYAYRVYSFQNRLIYKNASRTYCIDLNNGNTLWRERTPSPFGFVVDGVDGIGANYFFSATVTTGFERWDGYLFIGNVFTNKEQILLTIPSDSARQTVSFFAVQAFVRQADTMLIIPYKRSGAYQGDKDTDREFFILYNLSKRRIEYTREFGGGRADDSRYHSMKSLVVNGRLYQLVNRTIQAFDLDKGEMLWRVAHEFEEGSGPEMAVIGHVLVVSAIDDNGAYQKRYGTFGMDTQTGQKLWEAHTEATPSSPLFVLNGVVYFADATLVALDVANGNIFYETTVPDLGRPSITTAGDGEFFVEQVAGMNAGAPDARIFVRSFNFLFCYRAAR